MQRSNYGAELHAADKPLKTMNESSNTSTLAATAYVDVGSNVATRSEISSWQSPRPYSRSDGLALAASKSSVRSARVSLLTHNHTNGRLINGHAGHTNRVVVIFAF